MGPLRMLLIVCNPLEVGDLPAMIEKLSTSRVSPLWGERIKVRRLEGNPTLEQIRSALVDYQLVHLLAQSVREGDKQYILLANEKGEREQVPAPVVAEAMSILGTSFPSLVFISAPLRDGWREDERVDHLGPVLINSGAQIVVDIERPMNPDALARFTEVFYAEIMRTDIVDQATAIARRAVFDLSRWDWTAPVLYTQSQDLQVTQQVSEVVEGTVIGVKLGKF